MAGIDGDAPAAQGGRRGGVGLAPAQEDGGAGQYRQPGQGQGGRDVAAAGMQPGEQPGAGPGAAADAEPPCPWAMRVPAGV
jgi:hypothetical protein